MPDYRLTVAGLTGDQLEFSAEIAVQLDIDDEPHWASVHTWTLPNPYFTGRERNAFLDQAAGAHGWALLPGRRQPTKTGHLTLPAAPADWPLVLTQATQTAHQARRVETAWHQLIADTPLPVAQVGQIAGFGRHRIYQIQNTINGPRGRRRANSLDDEPR